MPTAFLFGLLRFFTMTMAQLMRIALYQPDIAGNVGTIIRTAACMGARVELIEPMGFAWSDRALSRAGMDYREAALVTRHADWDAFLNKINSRIILFTTRAAQRIDLVEFQPDDVLLFGSEGAGVPDAVHDRADIRARIPMIGGMRSLNLAVSAGIALSEALRQTKGYPE